MVIFLLFLLLLLLLLLIIIINIFLKKCYGWCFALSLLTACPKNQLYRCNQIPSQ